MGSFSKSFSLLVALFLILALLTQSIVYAQTSSSYVSPTGVAGSSFSLTIYSPNSQAIYNNTMPLIFKLTWTYDLLPVGNLELVGNYAYRIDNSSFVSIASNDTANDHYGGYGNWTFKTNPSFSYSLHISNLTNGQHEISIEANMYYGKNLLLNASAIPVQFLVQNPTPSLTATIPEFPTLLIILPLFAVMLLSIVFARKRNRVYRNVSD